MGFLLHPNTAYLVVITAIMLLIAIIVFPKPLSLKFGAVVFLSLALYELWHLKANGWALIMAACSTLTFMLALRQSTVHFSLLAATIALLTVGSIFVFTDPLGRPVVNLPLAGFVSIFCGEFIWIALSRGRYAEGRKLSDDPASIVGMVGTARTEIHYTGIVQAEGELWQARSDTVIPKGSLVRILRCDGAVLTVKKMEKLTR